MSIGERLILLRKSLDINQTDMAMVFGCTQANISYYEKDGNTLPVKYIIQLRDTYNVQLDWLLLGRGEMFITDTHTKQPTEPPVAKASVNPKTKNKVIKKINELSTELQRVSQELQELKEYIEG